MLRYQKTKAHWTLYRKQRRKQAVVRLARTIRDERQRQHVRLLAVETLSYAVDKTLHPDVADRKLYAAANPIEDAI